MPDREYTWRSLWLRHPVHLIRAIRENWRIGREASKRNTAETMRKYGDAD